MDFKIVWTEPALDDLRDICSNWTETGIAQVLLDKGVLASNIILGFHSPFKRQFNRDAVT
jgi:XisI protein